MEKFNFHNTTEYAEYVLNQANIVLDKCQIYKKTEDRKGLLLDIEKSITAKSWLMDNIFKNSPYHNGKGQLILPMEIERAVDEDIIFNYAYYIERIARNYYLNEEAMINGYTYRSAEDKAQELKRLIRAVDYMNIPDDDIIIKGVPFSKYREKYDSFKNIIWDFEISDEYYYAGNNIYTTRENKNLYDKACVVADAIKHCIGKQLEDESDIEKLANAFPNSQCRKGIKITRVVQKCLKELGLYQVAMENEKETFNKKYAAWTDAVSPMKVKKWSVLSINFVDFLTMSHGDTWTSCLNTDQKGKFVRGEYFTGFNSKRVLDYALDPSTMVFYTVDESYNGVDFELQPKSTRQLFHFGENKLVQARLYPQSNVSRRNIYTQYRTNVEHLLADAMGEANLWSAPIRGTISWKGNVVNIPYSNKYDGDYIDFLNIACHGGNERDFQSEVNYVVFRGSSNQEDNDVPMIVGSTDAVCIMCGGDMGEHYHSSIMCGCCY